MLDQIDVGLMLTVSHTTQQLCMYSQLNTKVPAQPKMDNLKLADVLGAGSVTNIQAAIKAVNNMFPKTDCQWAVHMTAPCHQALLSHPALRLPAPC